MNLSFWKRISLGRVAELRLSEINLVEMDYYCLYRKAE